MTYAEMNLTVPSTEEYSRLQTEAAVASANYYGYKVLEGLTPEEKAARARRLERANQALWSYQR